MDGPTASNPNAPRAPYQRRYQNVTDDISPKKSMLVVVIVVGCFAVLWPKVFYPMLVGNANQALKPNAMDKAADVKQERPPNMRPEIIHPAFRERGSAIPKPPGTQSPRKHIRTVEGRPGPIPGMRPAMGGAGHVVPPPQKGGSTMGVLMPIYTIGIVIFFSYTLMKLIFKRDNTGVRGNLYPPVDPDPRFRREVFESEQCRFKPRLSRDPTGRIVVNAMSALLDEVNQEIEARRKANEVKNQAKTDRNIANGSLSNGAVHKDQEQASVKVLGMETTASCEGGEKWTKPGEPVMPQAVPKIEVAPPQEIYLEGALPAQSQILVTDSGTVTQAAAIDTTSDPAVVLAGKMTLSVISMDNAEEEDETKNENNGDVIDVNGDETIDDIEESKYTTASSATAAEHEVSDEQNTDEEDVDEEVERIHDLDLDVNHISTSNEEEAQDQNDGYNETKSEEQVARQNNVATITEQAGQNSVRIHEEINKEEEDEEIEVEEEIDVEEDVEVEVEIEVEGDIEVEEEIEEEDEVDDEEEEIEIEIEEEDEEEVDEKENTEATKEVLDPKEESATLKGDGIKKEHDEDKKTNVENKEDKDGQKKEEEIPETLTKSETSKNNDSEKKDEVKGQPS